MGTALRHGFKSWAEKKALEQRTLLGLRPEAPMPAERLAAHYGISIIDPRRWLGLPESIADQLLVKECHRWSALTLFPGGSPLIVLNTTHSLARQESNLYHELAHLLCGHKVEQMVPVPGFPIPLRDYNAVQEEEAKWLGACLHLPKPALLWAHFRWMDVPSTCVHFNASTELVTWRIRATGIAKVPRRR